ncbi:von Willebrand factor A domain-containing protein 5A-like isoform X2 [Ruditapes philippinarum]|uniref:von Willebrand factor A domain-containing protein 5A-like isoform X2 n=1 Tax=Ruditapes philippinarum TaxID=129788 RepID=UPI00295AAF4D|nr:von Willebrand factor A domain-containing protein 5A-like isoform X2 [Ruditapes philippinarum]
MNADMGGTEILQPLEHVFNKNPIPSHPRRVFVLTDGQVDNTDAVIGLVRKESINTSTRVFTLGIGHGVSTALIDGIARNGGGKSEFISGEDRIQPKVISLLKRAMQPAITDISLDWDLPPGITPVSIPTKLPNILSAGERLTLFAVLQNVDRNASYAPSTVTLKGVKDGNAVSYSLTFTLCEADNINASAAVHRLATKLQIKLLQDQDAESAAQLDDIGYSADLDAIDVNRKKVVSLSCQGNIISKYTSFVAIDTDGKKVEGTAAKRSCPVPSLSSEFVKGIEERRRMLCNASLQFRMADSVEYGEYESCEEYSFAMAHRSENKNKFNATAITYDERQENCSGNNNGFDAICEAKVSTNKLFAHADPPALKTKSKKKARLFGCGFPLPKIFSKRFKSKGASKCSDLTSRPDEANKIDNANLKIKLYDGETNRTEEDKGNRKSVEDNDSAPRDNTRENSAENVTGSGESTSQQKGDHMISVIGLQQLRGQWNMSDQLLQLLDVTKEDVVDKLTFSKDSSVVCTVLVLAWLRKQFSQRQEEWQMIEAKALAWISSQNPSFTSEEHIKHTTEVMWTK